MAQAHVLMGAAEAAPAPLVRKIGVHDLTEALSQGWDDFTAMPSHAIFLCVIYPVVGIVLAQLTLGYAVLPFLFPIAAGFALIGPVAALGLYELSRRREQGLDTDAVHALDVLRSPSIGAIAGLAFLLTAIFVIWLGTADAIYVAHFGYAMPASISEFVDNVLFTPQGWSMIVIGNAIGFLFAAAALILGAISFPLLLDRDVGAAVALMTSIRLCLANPGTMALWGLIVAVLLAAGSLPLFVGLAVVMPVLGHATWHLYRRAIDAHNSPPAEFRPPADHHRSAADFPSSLFR
ncbi:MAG: DUF2189 domain-containing protein [Pseudolabrys sp.]|nr:DUF2189 domain-containing protein [Pseudolabrys sp.]